MSMSGWPDSDVKYRKRIIMAYIILRWPLSS